MKSVKYCIQHPSHFLLWIAFVFKNFFPDMLYLKIVYRARFGCKLNLNNPKGFNEKLNWLKLYNQNHIYTVLADKFAVKQYVKKTIGEKYVVPCYGVWKSFDEIEFSKLPQQFVLKTNHDSSGAVICLDKSKFDYQGKRTFFNKVLKRNWFYQLREWPYKNIPHQILAEQYLDDGTGTELRDYKFWCFNGVPKVMYITNKGKEIYENFYDMDFKPLDIDHGFPRKTPEYAMPSHFGEMKKLASQLSKGFPFIRVDFFLIKENVYFGEFTFYDWGGMKPLNKKWEERAGTWINLSMIRR